MLDIAQDVANGFLHAVHHHSTAIDHGVPNRRPSAYQLISWMLTFAAIIAAICTGAVKESPWWTGRLLVAVPLVWFWPFVVLAVMGAAVLAAPVFIAVSWLKLIPSKATRIARKQRKIDDLQGDLAQLRSN